MGMKVVLGVGDKSLEKYITEMPEVDVLTTVRRREGIIDAIVNYNPHAVILSMALPGKADYRDILPKIKELRHKAKIVFIYGDKDDEFRYFADFLVEQGIYNFIAGAIDPYSLADVILKDYTLSDVEHYRLSREEIIADVEACNDKIEAVTGVRPTLIRPPYGEYDDNVITAIRSIGMEPIQWDVDSLDWKDLSAQEITKRVTSKVQAGSIVLFHNAALHTPEALPTILETLLQEGYTFVPISQLILPGTYNTDYTIDHTGRQMAA